MNFRPNSGRCIHGKRVGVRLLLDTHALLWWLADGVLDPIARNTIADPATDMFVSAASAWEISIKRALGKLEAPDDLGEQLTANDFEPLHITVEYAEWAGARPPHHDDPFDRMLIAQSRALDLVIVTRDPRFNEYGVPLYEPDHRPGTGGGRPLLDRPSRCRATPPARRPAER